jgi:hypothetical protein
MATKVEMQNPPRMVSVRPDLQKAERQDTTKRRPNSSKPNPGAPRMAWGQQIQVVPEEQADDDGARY